MAKKKRMTPKEVLKVINKALKIFISYQQAHKWLVSDCTALGNRKPINQTYQVVCDELKRIAHGVLS